MTGQQKPLSRRKVFGAGATFLASSGALTAVGTHRAESAQQSPIPGEGGLSWEKSDRLNSPQPLQRTPSSKRL